ncbi:long-chain-fatty-acid--CoA ligase FadD2 [soil metagenome]
MIGAFAAARAGFRPERPDRLPRAMLAAAAWGPTLAGAMAAGTARYPGATAIVDDTGTMSYGALWAASDGVARRLREGGVGPGTTVGILARNHRGFVVSLVAAAKLGADLVFLNTGFAAPQLADVVASEGVDAVLHDDEFSDLVAGCGAALVLAETELTACATRAGAPVQPTTRRPGRMVILTSGTTGRPKGAVRSSAGGADSLAPLLSTVPVRARDTVVLAAPLFHAWGLAHLGMGLGLSSTLVLDRRFDPERTVAAVARHRAAGLVVVPVMLRRILDLGGPVLDGSDTSSLRYIASSGSALGAPLATAALDRFGPVLYNVYGSTEVSLATIAGPTDLAAAPGTAGRPPPGSTVRVVDDAGRAVAVGTTGRIFVGNSSRFDGYTGGGGKESIDGLLSIGDLGHFDAAGRLFIDGRDDEMIVSGGENVFPAEVEELLAGHPAVAEAAVVGVDDDELGQRLVAFVVKRPRARVTAEQLRSHVRDQLARHKVPKAVHFVGELPRTTTGKVRKRDLGASK